MPTAIWKSRLRSGNAEEMEEVLKFSKPYLISGKIYFIFFLKNIILLYIFFL